MMCVITETLMLKAVDYLTFQIGSKTYDRHSKCCSNSFMKLNSI